MRHFCYDSLMEEGMIYPNRLLTISLPYSNVQDILSGSLVELGLHVPYHFHWIPQMSISGMCPGYEAVGNKPFQVAAL